MVNPYQRSSRSTGTYTAYEGVKEEKAITSLLKSINPDHKSTFEKRKESESRLLEFTLVTRRVRAEKKLFNSVIEWSGILTVLEFHRGKIIMSLSGVEMLELGLKAIDKELANFNSLGAMQVNKKAEKAHQVVRLASAALGGVVSEIKSIQLEISELKKVTKDNETK